MACVIWLFCTFEAPGPEFRPRSSSPFQENGRDLLFVMVIAVAPMVWSYSDGTDIAGVLSMASLADGATST
jgi:hypothetical protein